MRVRILFTGTLNVLLRVRSIASVDSVVWTKSGHQGPDWKKAFFDISPSGPFQVMALAISFLSNKQQLQKQQQCSSEESAQLVLLNYQCNVLGISLSL